MLAPVAWKTVEPASPGEVLAVLDEIARKGWLSRGHARGYGTLTPSIDRPPRVGLGRAEKLGLERCSIEAFRSSATVFAHEGERLAMTDDPIALTVLQHYGVPTRVLDWSRSPFIAAFFAARSHPDEDGEIWTFDEPLYEREDRGPAQWGRWPETTVGRTGHPSDFQPHATAFRNEESPPWICCIFYEGYAGFPRQKAQRGAFTMMGRFGLDHADAIAELLRDESAHVRYRIRSEVKADLLVELRSEHGVWHGPLFPDTAGAAEISKTVFL